MRFAKIGTLGAMMLMAAGCQTDDGGATAANLPPLAFVRYVNAVPDSTSLDSIFIRLIPPANVVPETTFFTSTHTTTVRWVDQVDFTPQTFVNVAYRGIGQGGYQGLEAGSRRFRIFTYDPRFFSTTQLADTAFTFVAGQYYTIIHERSDAGEPVRIELDALPAVSGTTVQYRVVNTAVAVGTVDAYNTATAATAIGGTPVAEDLPLFGSTAFFSQAPTVNPAVFAVQFTAPNSAVSLAGANAPAGTAGSTTVNGLAGAQVGGSVLTAYTFGAVPARVFHGRSLVAAVAPTVVWVQDRQPALTAP
jgi:hypothetical protein